MVEQKYTPPRSRIVSGVPLGIETIPPVPGGPREPAIYLLPGLVFHVSRSLRPI
jgi:hypothetical protein